VLRVRLSAPWLAAAVRDAIASCALYKVVFTSLPIYDGTRKETGTGQAPIALRAGYHGNSVTTLTLAVADWVGPVVLVALILATVRVGGAK